MDQKISELTAQSTINTGDYSIIYNNTDNFKLNLLSGIDGLSTQSGEPNKILKLDNIGFVNAQGASITDPSLSECVLGPGSIDLTDSIDNSISINTTSITFSDGLVVSAFSSPIVDGQGGIFASQAWTNSNFFQKVGTNPIESHGYIVSQSGYIANSSSINLSNTHNGRTIISSNTTGITYTIPTGLSVGFSCQIIQTSTGNVSITGAPGVTLNSYGGLTQIAGAYASAGIQYVGSESYILAGNLS